MFVVVVVVPPVDVPLVEVVDVVVVAYLDVSAVLAVFMVVPLGGHMAGDCAFVVVPVVGVVLVSVVDVVDMAGMFYRVMSAVRPMNVGVLFVGRVRPRRHLVPLVQFPRRRLPTGRRWLATGSRCTQARSERAHPCASQIVGSTGT